MVVHFFYDIIHFDSKFFITAKDLIFRPGFLSKEYMVGRRSSYLHPVKMYVFTSAVFFLFFFSFFNTESEVKESSNLPLTAEKRADILEGMEEILRENPADSFIREKIRLFRDTSKVLYRRDIPGGGFFLSFTGTSFSSYESYDSMQRSLPAKERDGWFRRRIIKKDIELKNRLMENPEAVLTQIADSVLHRMPYMLFVSLPLFALILKLVYIRRKQFYYVDHGIFTIHLYIFSFVVLLVVFAMNGLQKWTGLSVFGWLIFLLFIGLLFYLYKGMRNFYGQRRGKTFVKFILVTFFSLLMMLVLFAIFMFLSAFTL